MRNLDNYQRFYDNEGNLLVGKLVFCEKGTTAQRTIYAWDSEHNEYVPANPVQFVAIDGQPSAQVYLDDADYTVYVYKYTGEGEMETDSDANNWVMQYSFNNLYDIFGIEISTQGIQVVGTLSELKALNPETIGANSNVKMIALAGWNALGDKPITRYYWDEGCNETATDVEYVKYSGLSVGRWVLVNDFSAGFDVRNAGCLPTATSAGDVEQTYGLQRAEAYCIKYGLLMIIPHSLGTQMSYYKLNNLIINSRLYVEDGAGFVTTNSATLNKVVSTNCDRNFPFIIRDASNKGSWQIVSDVIETDWFQNNDAQNEPAGWRPSILPRSKLVYNKKFDINYDSTQAAFSFERIAVDIQVQPQEKLVLDRCDIKRNATIMYPCAFNGCSVGQGLFNSTIDYVSFSQMVFVGCSSDMSEWNDPNLFVLYKAIQQDPTIDLQGQWSTIDLGDYGLTYSFQNIDNAIFDHLEMPSYDGVFAAQLYMHNVKCSLLIGSHNTNLNMWTLDDCEVHIEDGSRSLVNCNVIANNTKFSSDISLLSADNLSARECKFSCDITILNNIANINDCEIGGNVTITANSASLFQVSFNDNIILGTSSLVFDLNGKSRCGFLNTSICYNVVQRTTARDFVTFVYNGGTWNNTLGAMQFVYKGNENVIKGDKVERMIHITCYAAGQQTGGDHYAQVPDAILPHVAYLYGYTLDDFVFNFNDKIPRAVKVWFENGTPNHNLSSGNDLQIYDNNGTLVNTSPTRDHTITSSMVVFKAGTSASTPLFQGLGYLFCKMDSDTEREMWGILHVEVMDDDTIYT